MVAENWSLTAKPCDSCKTAPAAVFCSADTAFLCAACDGKIHAANKVASRHCRVWVCEVCEQAPAAVTCKADAAALCAACDRDIHSANPLARRHERVPVVPFYDAVSVAKSSHSSAEEDFSQEEAAEAASWLLPDPNAAKLDEESDSACHEFTDMNSYLDLELISSEQKPYHNLKNYSADGVVPVQGKNEHGSGQYPEPVVDGYPTYEMDSPGFKPYMYNFTAQSISHTSSQDVGLVPDHNAAVSNVVADGSEGLIKNEAAAVPVYGIHREARVLRYREKRKNRKFEKTIRYASRKAYAETRPRIKGRFAKRSELEVESFLSGDASYGVVPTF